MSKPGVVHELLHQDVTQAIIGAFFEVYNQLGRGFLESVYENALAQELGQNGLSVIRQFPITVHFRGYVVGQFKTGHARK